MEVNFSEGIKGYRRVNVKPDGQAQDPRIPASTGATRASARPPHPHIHHPLPLLYTIGTRTSCATRGADVVSVNSRGKGLDVDAGVGALRLPVGINSLKFVGIFICLLALLMVPFTAAHADTNTNAYTTSSTSNNGRIYGQLLDGTNKNAPLAQKKVTLQVAQGNLGIDLATVTTDTNGAYSFPNLSTDKATSYSVFFTYEGAQYNSPLTNLASKPVQHVNLTVYEATTSMAKIAVVEATILLHPADAKNGVVPVSELIIFRNLGDHTYVGSLNASANKGMPNALRFSLPHTANNLSLSAGFNGYQSVQVNSGFATNAAVPPGDSQFSFTFNMPYTASSYDFDYMVNYPTVRLTMMVPVAIHASSDTLQSLGPITAYQQEYDLFAANALRNIDVHVQLEGLPLAGLPGSNSPSNSASSPNTNLLWLLVGLLAMAGILYLTWFLYRSRYRLAKMPAPAKKKAQQAQKSVPVQKPAAVKAAKTGKARTSNKTQASDEQALLEDLLELDKSYEAGTLKKAEYQEQRAKIKAQLRALLSEKVTS